MNSEDQTAPPPGVAVVSTPEGVQQRNSHTGSQPRKRARKRHRHRNRKRKHTGSPNHNSNHNSTANQTVLTEPRTVEDRPAVTEGTQLHQARQNHSTYDRVLHHRGRGGTGYGYRHDRQQPESELRGDQLPAGVLPSYAHILTRIRTLAAQQGETPQQDGVYDQLFPPKPMDEDPESQG